jgi:hypothetical protein
VKLRVGTEVASWSDTQSLSHPGQPVHSQTASGASNRVTIPRATVSTWNHLPYRAPPGVQDRPPGRRLRLPLLALQPSFGVGFRCLSHVSRTTRTIFRAFGTSLDIGQGGSDEPEQTPGSATDKTPGVSIGKLPNIGSLRRSSQSTWIFVPGRGGIHPRPPQRAESTPRPGRNFQVPVSAIGPVRIARAATRRCRSGPDAALNAKQHTRVSRAAPIPTPGRTGSQART